MKPYAESQGIGLCGSRMNCFGCGSCAAACPQKAISMRQDEEGFLYPAIDRSLCANCGLCRTVCPARAPVPRKEGKFYAFRCRDAALLQKSSSGGAFSLLAEEVLSAGGLVCGACFDEGFRVRHQLSDKIAPMRKSKYIQSDIADCFVPVKDALSAEKQVLFSGTPCQCHGLLAFLGRKPAELKLVSLVCRGVASPGFWQDYIRWLERDGRLEGFDFRDKSRANDGHTVAYTINGREKTIPMYRDGFSRLYSLNLLYRPSCYVCRYCSTESDFDFTIGDFWGIEKVLPKLADGKGTSLLITHSKWAEGIIEKLRNKADIFPCLKENALQPALLAPAKEPLLRRFLFQDFKKKNTDGCCDMSLILKKYSGYR